MKRLAFIALSAFCLAAFGLSAKDSPQPDAFKKALGRVPAAERPAAAAELVKQAMGGELRSRTRSVLNAALELNPAAAPAIIGAIAKSVPEMAAVAAGWAAAEQPKLASAIARAAAAQAPGKAGEIAAAVCRAVPNEYLSVAVAVTEAAPGSTKAVLEGLAAVIPSLKERIQEVLAGGSVDSIAAALTRPEKTGSGPSSSIARGPGIGPPYIPYSGTARTVTPATSGEVQGGGRDYARP